MENLFLILEAVLFFAWAIMFFGRKKSSTGDKRLGFFLFVAWIGVLVLAFIWSAVRMFITT